MLHKKIGVSPPEEFEARRGLFSALTSLFPVEFCRSDRDFYPELDGLILFNGSRDAGLRAAAAGIRCQVVLEADAGYIHCESGNINFGRTANLHPCFQDRTLVDVDVEEFAPVSLLDNEEPVAFKEGHILWAYRPGPGAGIDLLAVAPPRLADSEYLWECFQPGRFLRLLPLLHFLRELTEDIAWTVPPLRACIMLDDPNLHGRSYGYIDFKELVRHATSHKYHVSFGTIPIDAWYAHSETTCLFRENSSRISLLIHGNNHTFEELAFPNSRMHGQAVLFQALNRIEKFEARSGLEVARVMSAPHSACTEEMLNAMLLLGYEAGCIPWDSLFRFNPERRWGAGTGLDMVDFLGGGLPVMTRVRLRPDWNPRLKLYPDWKTGVILNAFLSQPIIVMGHHTDTADGLNLLGEVADTVNRLGDVIWMDMKAIARSNYMTRSDGTSLGVKMYSRRIVVRVPDNIRTVWVERPWVDGGVGQTEVLVCKRTGAGPLKLNAEKVTTLIPVEPLETIELASIPDGEVDLLSLPSLPFRLWPPVRRLMTEGRDRILPILSGRR